MSQLYPDFQLHNPVFRGDIFKADLYDFGYQEYGYRPVVIIQNDDTNAHSPRVIVAILTSSQKVHDRDHKLNLTIDPKKYGMEVEFSTVVLNQIDTIGKGRLKSKIARLDSADLKRLNEILALSLGMEEQKQEAKGMNELITINELNKQFPISARELYEKLGFDVTHWAAWSRKNITENEFAYESTDYEVFAVDAKSPNGRPSQDFNLTIDFAKRVCMMARTAFGESIRQYFIEVEKRYKMQQLPQTPIEALLSAVQIMQIQEKRLAQLEDKAATLNNRMDNLDLTNIEGTPRQRLVKMVQRYAHKAGITYSLAWEHFTSAYNTAYHTNLKARRNNLNSGFSIPEFLEKAEELADGIRVADKLLNQ